MLASAISLVSISFVSLNDPVKSRPQNCRQLPARKNDRWYYNITNNTEITLTLILLYISHFVVISDKSEFTENILDNYDKLLSTTVTSILHMPNKLDTAVLSSTTSMY